MVRPFHERLDSEGFQVIARVNPPKSCDLSPMLSSVASWNGKVGSVVVSDNPFAIMGISSLVVAEKLKQDGHDVIVTISCRDRNRIALGSIVLGCAALSLGTVLCVSGDHFHFGDHQEAKPVYDLDSVQLISMLREMERGKDMGGNSLDCHLSFFLGAAVCATADPLGPQIMKAKKKAAAGADFWVTLPIFTMDQLDPFLFAVKDMGVKIIAGVLLPSYEEIVRYQEGSLPGTFVPDFLVTQWRDEGENGFRSSSQVHVQKLVSELKESGKVSGVCISATGRELEIGALL